jgi:hypothetical protein
MTHILLRRAGLALAFAVMGSGAMGGPIEAACNKSDRKASSRPMCSCIQQVADKTLAGSDQRRAADLIKNPEKAHKTWQSQSNRDDAFWERYKLFGDYAEKYCAANS